jgi:hypothetical protein
LVSSYLLQPSREETSRGSYLVLVFGPHLESFLFRTSSDFYDFFDGIVIVRPKTHSANLGIPLVLAPDYTYVRLCLALHDPQGGRKVSQIDITTNTQLYLYLNLNKMKTGTGRCTGSFPYSIRPGEVSRLFWKPYTRMDPRSTSHHLLHTSPLSIF